MVCKIIWTEKASDDLAAIVRYISRHNPFAAERVGYGIYDRVQILSTYPEFGSIIPEFNDPEWRQLVYPPYRIIYHLSASNKTAEIVRIWHGARGDVQVDNPET
jgi:toxin ParE1/3/4